MMAQAVMVELPVTEAKIYHLLMITSLSVERNRVVDHGNTFERRCLVLVEEASSSAANSSAKYDP